MIKLDLHTHSTASPDGGLTIDNYQKALTSGLLDYIAITDHNHIDFATRLQQSIGEQIIVGEEIMSSSGEIIGLYLTKLVRPGLSPIDTVRQIKDQGGLVYIPHPFETVRHGLHPEILEELVDYIDIMEIYNGRAFAQNRSAQTVVWAKLNHLIGAASSDAHGYKGLGNTYTDVSEPPTRNNIMHLVSEGTPIVGKPSFRSLLYPKYHRIKKKVTKNS